VFAALLAFVVGFALFWPRVLLVVDEDRYVSQAVAFASGGTTVAGAEILLPPSRLRVISDYPPGTSLLQTPFVWLGGWRAAALASVLSLVAATLLTMRWLRGNGLDQRFALLIPGFLGAAFFARVGMSDVPAAAIVALSLYLLARAERAKWGTALAAGFCTALIFLFREPVILVLAPFVIALAIRRRDVIWALVLGGVAGVAIRLAISAQLFGSPFYVRDPGYGVSLANLAHTVPLYAFLLMVLIPGGALLPFFYRGPRRIEALASFGAYVGLFLLYSYDPIRENGLSKGIILASRFMVPLLPVLALMAADVWPRIYARLAARSAAPANAARWSVCAAAVGVAFLVHPLANRQERAPLEIVRDIYAHTTPAVPVITNSNATLKYLSPAYGPRKLILRYNVGPESTVALAKTQPLTVVLLSRRDSEAHRAETEENTKYVVAVSQRCSLRAASDRDFGWAQLRIFDVVRCE
jgi:4-amino-4-deoxy-L-arabinose transferase-like glycosyltransferase